MAAQLPIAEDLPFQNFQGFQAFEGILGISVIFLLRFLFPIFTSSFPPIVSFFYQQCHQIYQEKGSDDMLLMGRLVLRPCRLMAPVFFLERLFRFIMPQIGMVINTAGLRLTTLIPTSENSCMQFVPIDG
jgi:hypothetical protein